MVALLGIWRVLAPETNANAQKPQSNKCVKERANSYNSANPFLPLALHALACLQKLGRAAPAVISVIMA
eukprot:927548-Amphidinium_carterae.1